MSIELIVLIVGLAFAVVVLILFSVMSVRMARALSIRAEEDEGDINEVVANVIRAELDRRGVPDYSSEIENLSESFKRSDGRESRGRTRILRTEAGR